MVEIKETGPGIIKAVTVPQLMQKYQVPGFECLKMDIEGEPFTSARLCPCFVCSRRLDILLYSSLYTRISGCFHKGMDIQIVQS